MDEYNASRLQQSRNEIEDEFLRAIIAGKTPMAAARLVGLKQDWFDARMKDPAFHDAFMKIWDAAPFETQERGKLMGRRFRQTLDDLVAAGIGIEDCAAILGVSLLTCERALDK